MSQKELARLAGIDSSTLCRLEQGSRKPTPRIFRKLARALEQPLDKLMDQAKMEQIPKNLPVFAERLHRLRRQSGLSQVQLAQVLEYPQSVLACCESGRNPAGYLLSIKVCACLPKPWKKTGRGQLDAGRARARPG